MAVDNPVHQLETGEGDWKKDSAVFVNVWSRHSKQLVQVLRLAVRIGRCRGRRGRQGHGHGGLWRHRRGRGCLDVVTHQVAHLHARGRASSVLHSWLQVRTYGPLLSFVVHAQIVHFEMDSLKMEQKSRLWIRKQKKKVFLITGHCIRCTRWLICLTECFGICSEWPLFRPGLPSCGFPRPIDPAIGGPILGGGAGADHNTKHLINDE